jgi:hypothetical protein
MQKTITFNLHRHENLKLLKCSFPVLLQQYTISVTDEISVSHSVIPFPFVCLYSS